MGLIEELGTEPNEVNLLSHFVDVVNKYGLSSLEFQEKYQTIVEQFPQMTDLLHETLLQYEVYWENNKPSPPFSHK